MSSAPTKVCAGCGRGDHIERDGLCFFCYNKSLAKPDPQRDRETLAKERLRAWIDQGGIVCASQWPEVERDLRVVLDLLK